MISCFTSLVPKLIAVEIAGDDGGFAGEPLGIVDDGLVQLADITFDVTAWNGHGPNGDEQKITNSAGYGQGNNPFAARFLRADDMKGFGDEDAEAFAGIVPKPAAFEAVLEAEV
jgi:hypothetical protein